MSFAGLNTRPSPWGYNWTVEEVRQQHDQVRPREAVDLEATSEQRQWANLPAALLNTLKREKKPFTYTPGGVNLSEVLNARLQKRMERKKRYSEEQEQSKSQKQVIVMPTYNTPLDMYSMENALEALEVQAELAAADKSLSASPPCRSATLPRNHTFRFEDLDPARGVAQSKAFRVLQIITDTEEDPAEKSRVQHRDEMRFTGLRESKAIPSKFFQTLQKMTGTDEDEDQQPPLHEHHSNGPHLLENHQQQPPPPATRPMFFPEQQGGPAAALRRPAAFLPAKGSAAPCFRPVQAPLSRKATVGTDF